MVATVLEDWDRIASGKDRWIGCGQLKLSDLKTGRIIDHIFDERHKETGGIYGRVMRRLFVGYRAHQGCAIRSGQSVADPLRWAIGSTSGVPSNVGVRFDDDVEVRGSSACSAAGYPDLARIRNGVPWAPTYGPAGRNGRMVGVKESGRRKAGVVDVPHHLVHAEASFLKGVEHLRFGAIALLRSAEQRKSGANHQEKNTESDEKFNQGETLLLVTPAAELHLLTMVSRVIGREKPLPLNWRTPRMNRLEEAIEPFPVIITAQRTS